jgi:hypothetical protein
MVKVYDKYGNKKTNLKITVNGSSVTYDSGNKDDLEEYEFVYYK